MINRFPYLLILSFLLFQFPKIGIAQNEAVFTEYLKNFDNLLTDYPHEKIYVHTDRDYYVAGDTIWFKVYLLNASSHRPMQLSKVIHLDLLDANGWTASKANIYSNPSSSSGFLIIPKIAGGGTYVLRATTRYMVHLAPSFYFRKPIEISERESAPATGSSPLTEDISTYTAGEWQEENMPEGREPDIQFFPEGGHLIAGKFTKVAFKGVNPQGNGFAFNGYLIDRQGRRILDFESDSYGLGSFLLNPVPDGKYIAHIPLNGDTVEVALPTVQETGYSISAAAREVLTIQGVHNAAEKDDFMVILHSRGFRLATLYSQEGNLLTRIPLRELPAGILTLSLVDAAGRVRAERLVFNSRELPEIVRVETEEDTVAVRQRVNLKLISQVETLDSAYLSLAIARPAFYDSSGTVPDIRSWLLLTSELRGIIETPGRYFDPKNKNRERDLDLLMMTQGWRRYEYRDYSAPLEMDGVILPEQGFRMSGKVTNFYNENWGVESILRLRFLEDPENVVEFRTDKDGIWSVENIQLYDTLTAIVQARRDRRGGFDADKEDPLKVHIDPRFQKEFSLEDSLMARGSAPGIDREVTDRVTDRVQEITDAYFLDQDIRVLEGVEVVAEREEDIDEGINMLYGEPSHRIIVDSIAGAINYTVLDLIRRFPGVQVQGVAPDVSIIIRGFSSIMLDNNAAILFDGVPVDISLIATMNTQNISFIDVITGPRANMFGSEGRNGVIAIYSKQGNGVTSGMDRSEWGVTTTQFIGFQPTVKFYTPRYENGKGGRPDFRKTLYWKGDIEISSDGGELSFYASDEAAEYDVVLEGIGSKGEIICWKGRLVVRER